MSKPSTVSTAKKRDAATGAVSHTWEDISGGNIWENAAQEDEEGRIVLANEDSLAEMIRKRRKRLEQNDYSQRNRRVVRDMIRYVYILIDCSRWMRQKDPTFPGTGTRLDAAIQMLQEFVQEYYDQNPLSHLGFVMIKKGEAEILTQLSSNSKTHKVALQSLTQMAILEGPAAGGEFSLQNGLEVAGRSLGHQPRHGSREIVVVTAALSTCDPGYILTETLPRLLQAKIRVSCFALTAELHICRKLADETKGTMGVCLDKAHFRDWLFGQGVPPPSSKSLAQTIVCEMINFGFPTRTSSDVAELVHATRTKTLLARTAFTCPQCQARNSELPTECAVCGLKLVLAPHLARSFHHLFPVPQFNEIAIIDEPNERERPPLSSSSNVVKPSKGSPKSKAANSKLLITSDDDTQFCYACLRNLGDLKGEGMGEPNKGEESLRFQCPECKNIFCVDCDAFLHETLHNCPGCLSMG